jgi:hypothetical protein
MKAIKAKLDKFNPKKMHRSKVQLIWRKITLGLWLLNFLLIICLFYRLSAIENLLK